MALGNAIHFSAFTQKATGIASVLTSNVDVYQHIPGKENKVGKYTAIWDTGATSTVITTRIVKELGLISSGKANLNGVAGSKENVDTFYIVVVLPNSLSVNVFRAVEAPSIAGNADVLIGMDIIALGDFSVTNVNKKTVFSFRYPSIETIDYVEVINEMKKASRPGLPASIQKKSGIMAPMKNNKVNGNLPCPRGSGKKWKQCHGKEKSKFHR